MFRVYNGWPWRWLLAALFVPALLCGALRTALAAGELTVGVLGLDAVDTPEEVAQALTAAVRQRAGAVTGIRLLPGNKDLIEAKLMFGCLDEKPECLAQAGRSLGAERLVYGSLRRAAGGGYTVVLKQLDVQTGTVERFISEPVAARALLRDSAELQELAASWVRVLLVSGLRGGLRVTSTPPGAEVVLDGQAAGKTPLTLTELMVGQHSVKLSLPGYDPLQRTVSVRSGGVAEVDRQFTQGAPATAPGADVNGGGGGPARNLGDVGKALKVASYFMVGAAAVAGGVAIYTWRTYSSDSDNARSALDVLQMNFPNAPAEVNAFFASQGQLSSCQAPAALTAQAMTRSVTSAAYSSYMDACQQGRTYANATTGLVATMGSLALLGVTTYIIGDRLSHRFSDKNKLGYRPRLTQVGPVVSATGGGVNLSVRF